jgi:hypothetical protein
VPEHLKRVRLSFARIPAWMAKQLQDQKQAGKQIEKALIHFYNLAPPG